MLISDDLISQLQEGCSSPDDTLGENGLLKRLAKKVAVHTLEVEMDEHLGYAKVESSCKYTGNSQACLYVKVSLCS